MDKQRVLFVAVVCLGVIIFLRKGPAPLKGEEIFVLCDFETNAEIKQWQMTGASISREKDHATRGAYSGKVSFRSGGEVSNIFLSRFLKKAKRGNWKKFTHLRFDIFSDNKGMERLTLKIKDKEGEAWQRSLYFEPHMEIAVSVNLEDLKPGLDLSGIKEFNLFRWEPKTQTVFYIDNIRLTREAKVVSSKKKREGTEFQLKDGEDLAIGVETSLRKVFLDPQTFEGVNKGVLEISLAKNEFESGQIVLLPAQEFKGVKIIKQDLTASINGREVVWDKNFIRCFPVGYVETKQPSYTVSHVGWWPDSLEEKDSFDVSVKTLQPVWVEIYAPEHLPAGDYKGRISFEYGDGKTKEVALNVHVWDFALPKQTHLKTAFDFYPNRLQGMYPSALNETPEAYQVRINRLAGRYYMDMIEHRLMPIFNFHVGHLLFKKQIQPFLDKGLDHFAVGRYGGSFNNSWPEDEDEFRKLTLLYRDYAGILRAAGLLDMAYVYSYDDVVFGDSRVPHAVRMIHQADKDLKTMVGLTSLAEPDDFPHWADDIDILCVRNVMLSENMIKKIHALGKEIWTFVSGPNPPFPTLVIDYPSMAYRIVPWMCWKYDIKGYLFWCVNFWENNPWENPTNGWEQNGNGYLYYPGTEGPVASIRLKVTRDGLEDYEYLFLLKEKAESLRKRGIASADLAEVDKLLNIDTPLVGSMADYTDEPELLYERRRKIAELLEKL